jgi:hypothetical protein
VRSHSFRPADLPIYVARTSAVPFARRNALKCSDLDDFVNCYFGGTSSRSSGTDRAVPSKSRQERKDSERFKSFTCEELSKRDNHSISNIERARLKSIRD